MGMLAVLNEALYLPLLLPRRKSYRRGNLLKILYNQYQTQPSLQTLANVMSQLRLIKETTETNSKICLFPLTWPPLHITKDVHREGLPPPRKWVLMKFVMQKILAHAQNGASLEISVVTTMQTAHSQLCLYCLTSSYALKNRTKTSLQSTSSPSHSIMSKCFPQHQSSCSHLSKKYWTNAWHRLTIVCFSIQWIALFYCNTAAAPSSESRPRSSSVFPPQWVGMRYRRSCFQIETQSQLHCLTRHSWWK